MTSPNLPITIRLAAQDDRLDLARLAALDSTQDVPAGPVLLAEVDGELRAALSLHDGSAIGDPFYPTADVIDLMRAHAKHLRRPRRRRRLLPERTRRLLARGRALYGELDYAQRRLLEIQTGEVLTPETARRRARALVAQLEALYELE